MTSSQLRFEAAASSGMHRAFAAWLGSVYAAEHEVPLDPDGLAAFDAADLMPLFHVQAEWARDPLEERLTIEEAWLADQLLLGRPSTCLLVDRFVDQPVDRVTRLRVTPPDGLVAELIARLARRFRLGRRADQSVETGVASVAEPSPIPVGVVVDGLAQVVPVFSADPRSRRLYLARSPRVENLRGVEAEADGSWTIGADELARIAVYAIVPEEALVEWSADIYAPTVPQEVDPSSPAPLELAWRRAWELEGPLLCLLGEGGDHGEVDRIPYRAVFPVDEIIRILVAVWALRDSMSALATMSVRARGGHAVTLLEVDEDGATFHDPWPEVSLLAAGMNDLGIEAYEVEDGWRITLAELRRCLGAVFLPPEALAELQGEESRRSLPEILEALSVFGVHEVRRKRRDGYVEVEVEPGEFRDHVQVAFAVDRAGRLEAALLSLHRPWLDGAGRPLAFQILQSFVAAAVSPLDGAESAVLIGCVAAIRWGERAVQDALAAGAAHLVGQARGLVRVVLRAQESQLLTLAFTRMVAANDGTDRWLHIGVERAGRSAGPLRAGARLPVPWESLSDEPR